MMHWMLAMLLLQGTPAGLWKSETDPFTDRFKVVLLGKGKSGKLNLRAFCLGIEPANRYGLGFDSEDILIKAATDDSGNGTLMFRFDNGSVEMIDFAGVLNLVNLTWMKDGKLIGRDDADAFVKRFADHDRLRIRLFAEKDDKLLDWNMEDFDISKVTVEMLEALCVCEKTPLSCVDRP